MAYESQQIRCPVCNALSVTPGEHVQTYASAHFPGQPQWSHRIPFRCESGCCFALIIEQSEHGTTVFTADHVMTWS